MAGGGRGLQRRAHSAGETRAGAVSSPPRRRSERTASSMAASSSPKKTCLRPSRADISPPPAPLKVKKPIIALKKIMPRSNRQVKEAAITPRRSPRVPLQEDKENVPEAGSPPAKEVAKANCTDKKVLSPVDGNNADGADERDEAMAKRVRSSYSRLELSFVGKEGNTTFSSTPDARKQQTLFGFDRLLMEDGAEAEALPANAINTGKWAEAMLELNTDLPGIAGEKQNRRRRKVPQFQESELDEWMAQMNAEFEEAEKFNLLVE
ncbi:sororin-B-like [Anolis carolinensis]|uniref:sororin-B-like n=1 Tax=Anolis carolinensis TaxID=28377 RepID=UPI002F2B392D